MTNQTELKINNLRIHGSRLNAYGDGSLLGQAMRDELLTPRIRIGADTQMGYGVYLREDGRFGHEGGDPGCEVQIQRLPASGVNVIALCNVNGYADDVHDLLLGAVRAGDGA